jgi:iron complex outermembrane receptor protein
MPVLAQESSNDLEGLQEIIVTAQKREQSLQDVPIAVTALNRDALRANRIVSVTDLSGLAPGLTVTPTSSAAKIPSYTLRGAQALGVVPGSDRQVSMYLDGVYLAASRGAIFDLPDVERIEVLRGPQGTLFGRNATAGAVSISTRDPTGEIGMKAAATVGNYDQYRFGLSFDLPQIGPFSGYVSYVHNERRGDIRNTAAGQVWDRTRAAVDSIAKVERSPRYLGGENSDSWFAALKFESGDFTTVYKYDRLRGEGTPPGNGLVGYNANTPLLGNLLTTLIQSQPYAVPITPNGKRPDAVANGFSVPVGQRAEGHSLTSTYQISDSLSAKNIFAYRTSSIFGASPIDGFSSLTITPASIAPLATFIAFSTRPPASAAAAIPGIAASLAPLVGSPFVGIASSAQGRTKQISDEFQLNYNSDFLTATAGALWFNAKDWTGEHLQQNTIQFTPVPGGVLTNTIIGRTFNEVTSIAAYAQLEWHVMPQLDVITGGRITQDDKSGTFTYGPNLTNLNVLVFSYKKAKPSYLIGVNYKPNDDTLLYGKYSTAYMSGGSTAGIPYAAETAASWEAGIKTELLDRRLRANLALFLVDYKHVQGSSTPTSMGMSEYITQVTGDPTRASAVGTFVVDQGDIRAKGFEFDFTAAPVTGVSLGGSLGYTDSKLTRVNPILLAANKGRYELIFRPDWTGNFWTQYDTPRLGGGDAYLSFRADARWQSTINLAQNPDIPAYQTFAAGIREIPAYWVFNGRVALKDLDLGGIKTQVAAWGRNLGDNRSANSGLNLGIIAAANYIPARTYGIDLSVEF